MKKQSYLFVVSLLICGIGAHALPPAFFDSARSGALSGGVIFSIDLASLKPAVGFELQWITPKRFGIGVTMTADIENFPKTGSFSLDGLYHFDFISSGLGFLVAPIKIRAGLFGPDAAIGFGASAGIEYYAVPFVFGNDGSMAIAPVRENSDFFLTMKSAAEIDFVAGKFKPRISIGSDLVGTIGGDSGSGYTYVIYY